MPETEFRAFLRFSEMKNKMHFLHIIVYVDEHIMIESFKNETFFRKLRTQQPTGVLHKIPMCSRAFQVMQRARFEVKCSKCLTVQQFFEDA